MKTGIMCAVDLELQPFLAHLKDCRTTKKAMLTFYEGSINETDIVTVSCGVGKTNAAIAAQILIDIFNADIIINSGTAGGMKDDLDLFETVIATESAYHDMSKRTLAQFQPYMPEVYFQSSGKLIGLSKKAAEKLPPEYTIFYGRMVTGDKFITDDGRDEINAAFEPLSVDMETASIAHVCYVNEVPFIAVRTITDTAKHSGIDNFEKNCIDASVVSKDVVLEILKEIKNF